jgi:hypothetical protein
MSIYDRGIEAAWDDIERRAQGGDPQCAEIIEEKERSEFVWALLQGDVIEKLGGITSATARNDGSPESELARRISGKLGVDMEATRGRLGELIATGVLSQESRGNGLRWHWSDAQRLKLIGEATPATSRHV